MLLSLMTSMLSGESSVVSPSDFMSIITEIQKQISVETIVGVIVAAIGACIALVFMWWGARKLTSMLMGAFRKGKLKF